MAKYVSSLWDGARTSSGVGALCGFCSPRASASHLVPCLVLVASVATETLAVSAGALGGTLALGLLHSRAVFDSMPE